MLKLENVKKTYTNGDTVVALKGVSLDFRQNEFAAILGPSGCGKTTMLNIIGGLDRYDSGDLVVKGVSTKAYKDADWDAYRNRSVGFVFQNYNLISHQTVLQNVELAMTLSGVSPSERRRRAKGALIEVGLSDKLNKKPNRLSGGQMQRVAIARALVNNPEIIMADEPTGALDSSTSLQIMEILKEVAKTRLVIMVTHNSDLAEKYATRMVRLLDGEVQSDSNPPTADELLSERSKTSGKTSMSRLTSLSLSFKNLLTKKGRTFTTAVAGSVGIISVALVLALSTGLNRYMDSMQSGMLASLPITINAGESMMEMGGGPDFAPDFITAGTGSGFTAFSDSDEIHRFNQADHMELHINVFSDEFLSHIAHMHAALPGAANAISHSHAVEMHILSGAGDNVVKFDTAGDSGGMAAMFGMGGSSGWQEIPDNHGFILSLYELIGENSRMP